jgi:hypothetical protein
MTTYKVVRFTKDSDKRHRTIAKGLTLQQAQQHCRQESTHHYGRTGDLEWYDGYTAEGD